MLRARHFPHFAALLAAVVALALPTDALALSALLKNLGGIDSQERLWLAAFGGLSLGVAFGLFAFELRSRSLAVAVRRLTDLVVGMDGRYADHSRESASRELARLSDELMFAAQPTMEKGTESPRTSRIQYLAGVLDSLGCIRIESLRKGDHASLCLWITSKHFEMMEAMQKFGAHVGQKSDGQYRAKWKDQKAYNIHKQVMPHLTFRKAQAKIGMEFFEDSKQNPTGENDQFYRMRLKLLKQDD